jgi:hypothetical protein
VTSLLPPSWQVAPFCYKSLLSNFPKIKGLPLPSADRPPFLASVGRVMVGVVSLRNLDKQRLVDRMDVSVIQPLADFLSLACFMAETSNMGHLPVDFFRTLVREPAKCRDVIN